MKFESKFGVGEVVYYRMPKSRDSDSNVLSFDKIMEVIAIQFEKEGSITVVARLNDDTVRGFKESELVGDLDFDQEKGEYPPEKREEY